MDEELQAVTKIWRDYGQTSVKLASAWIDSNKSESPQRKPAETVESEEGFFELREDGEDWVWGVKEKVTYLTFAGAKLIDRGRNRVLCEAWERFRWIGNQGKELIRRKSAGMEIASVYKAIIQRHLATGFTQIQLKAIEVYHHKGAQTKLKVEATLALTGILTNLGETRLIPVFLGLQKLTKRKLAAETIYKKIELAVQMRRQEALLSLYDKMSEIRDRKERGFLRISAVFSTMMINRLNLVYRAMAEFYGLKSLVKTLERVVSRQYESGIQKMKVEKTMQKYGKGLALLRNRFQQIATKSPYRSCANVRLSRTLLSDFSLTTFHRVVNSLQSKLLASAFARIRFIPTYRNRVLITLKTLENRLISKNLGHLVRYFGRWSQINVFISAALRIRKNRKDSAVGKIVKISRIPRVAKQRFSTWRRFVYLCKREDLQKVKTGLIFSKVNNIRITHLQTAWKSIRNHLLSDKRKRANFALFANALVRFRTKAVFSRPFSILKTYSKKNFRRRMALQRVLKLQRYKKAIQVSRYLGKLYHRLIVSAVFNKRKQFRCKQSTRILTNSIYGVLTFQKKSGFDTLRLHTSLPKKSVFEAKTISDSKHTIQINVLQKHMKMVRALYRLRTSQRIVEKETIRRWKARVGDKAGRKWEAHIRLAWKLGELTKRVKNRVWKEVKTAAKVRTGILLLIKNVDRAGFRVKKTAFRSVKTLGIPESLMIVQKMAEKQVRIQAKFEALIRQQPQSHLFSLQKPRFQLTKTLPKFLYRLSSILTNHDKKIGFQSLKSFILVTNNVRRTPDWSQTASYLTRKSTLVQFLLSRVAEIPERYLLMNKYVAFERIQAVSSRVKDRIRVLWENFHTLEALALYRKQTEREAALKRAVHRWRQVAKVRLLTSRRRAIGLISALLKAGKRHQFLSKAQALHMLQTHAIRINFLRVAAFMLLRQAASTWRSRILSLAVS